VKGVRKLSPKRQKIDTIGTHTHAPFTPLRDKFEGAVINGGKNKRQTERKKQAFI
jgi:hypothetical protein